MGGVVELAVTTAPSPRSWRWGCLNRPFGTGFSFMGTAQIFSATTRPRTFVASN